MSQEIESKQVRGTGHGARGDMGSFHVGRLLGTLQGMTSAGLPARWSSDFRLVRPPAVSEAWKLWQVNSAGVFAPGLPPVVRPPVVVAVAPVLSDAEAAAARRYFVGRLALLERRAGFVSIAGDEAGKVESAALSALVDAVERLQAWAAAVGIVGEAEARRAAAACPAIVEAVAARRAVEAAEAEARRAAAGVELAKLRRVRVELESGERSPLGSAGASLRRRGRIACQVISGPAPEVVVPVSLSSAGERAAMRHAPGSVAWARAVGGPLVGFARLSSLRRAGVRLNRHHKRRAALVASLVASLGDMPTLAACGRVAEARARKWVGGTSATTAAEACERGGAAAADDVGAFFVRILGEARGIFREISLSSGAGLLERFRGLGLRVNRRMRREAILGRDQWREWEDGNGKRKSARGLGNYSRAMAEAWEYGASRARDGREVGGSFAMQGAIHGLADFSLSSVVGFDSERAAEDMDSADWSQVVDGAAARAEDDAMNAAESLEALRVAEASAEFVAAGYSGTLAAALSDALEGVGQDGARAVAPPSVQSRPSAGAGCGSRPSVLRSLDQWAGEVRGAFAARVHSAEKARAARIIGAGANAGRSAESAARSLDLVEGLACWLRDGEGGPPAEVVAEFIGGAEGGLTDAARQRLKRLRDRAGIVVESGPARAVERRGFYYSGEVEKGRGKGLHVVGLYRAASRFEPSFAGDEWADSRLWRIACCDGSASRSFVLA